MNIDRLKYRVFYNVVNKPNCQSASSMPCWSNITNVSRYVALTVTSLLSTYVDSFTELFRKYSDKGYAFSKPPLNIYLIDICE